MRHKFQMKVNDRDMGFKWKQMTEHGFQTKANGRDAFKMKENGRDMGLKWKQMAETWVSNESK